MRIAALVAVLLSACASVQTVASEAKSNAPVAGMIERTKLLSSPGCSSVRVGAGLVFTAQHCVEDRYKVGETYSGLTVQYISDDHDFAILSGDAPVGAVTMRNAEVGEHLYIVGYPSSVDDDEQYLTVTDGIYTGVTFENMERVTAYAYYGNSGGGVWGDDGALLGLLVQGRPTDSVHGAWPNEHPVFLPAHSYITPIRFVREALD